MERGFGTAKDQRFRLTAAHIRALRDLVFIFSQAEPERGLSACLLTDPLSMFGGKAPGLKVAEWIGISDKKLEDFDVIARQQIVDFYHSIPLALGIAQQAISLQLEAREIEARGALAMVMGYGNPDTSGACEMPGLSQQALQIILDLADDAQRSFDSLAPLVEGVINPVVQHCPSEQQMRLLKSLVFNWTWFDLDRAEFADRFFEPCHNISLMDYLDRIPTISAPVPTAANCEAGQVETLETLELSVACMLDQAGLQPGEYYRGRETQWRWKPMLRVAASAA